MTKILAIASSYRKGGITDQAVEVAARDAREHGAEIEVVQLRDYPIEFCRNCRECTQLPGVAPGACVLDDGMREWLAHYEENRDLIQVGAYRAGADPLLDVAFQKNGAIEKLLYQGSVLRPFAQTIALMQEIAGRR